MVRLESLAEVFAQVPDPRDPRGVRHPLSAILSLVFLGMLARIREMAVLERWASTHWELLREPLGFDRDEPPHATTISRTIARCDLTRFTAALLTWVRQFVPNEPFDVAVDAKTSCQGLDEDGQPVQLVTVLVHQLKLVLAQWSVRGEKTNEPTVLRNHLSELLANFPGLKLVTGDAIYAQRPLAEELQAENCDYLLQIRGNQGDILNAVEHCLGPAHERPPVAQTAEKGDAIERRQLWLDLENAEYIRDKLHFPGCQIALRVDRDITADDGTVRSCDTRYFVTSLNPDTVCAAELLAKVRRHWEIENSVFFLKDRWWDEDRHWTSRPGLSQWLAQLTTVATMALRIFCSPSEPLRAHADYIAWSPRIGLEILGLE